MAESKSSRLSLNLTEILALASFVVFTVLRLVLGAKLGLGDDEAYYWDWIHPVSLSYYDHPGMTAWLIKLGTLLFGDTPLGVRFFGVVCGTLTMAILWWLGRRIFGRTTAALAVLFYLFSPIFVLGGLLMVPDAPMGLAWIAVIALVWKIYGEKQDRWSLWALAGVALGLGFLSKYTILLLALSVALLFLSDREGQRQFLKKGFWSAVLISAIFCLPILLWNIQYDWPSVKFHLHDRQTGGGGANFTRWTQYFVSQAVALGPALFFLVLGTIVTGARRFRDRRWRFILLLSAPTFLIFTLQALYAEFKPHWPAPAYTLLFIGAAELVREGFGLASERAQKRARVAVLALIFGFVVPIVAIFHIGTVTPIIPKIARAVAPNAPWDIKFDPTNDLYGWEEAIKEVYRIREEARARGEEEPFISSSRYQLVAQLAFTSGERVWRVIPTRDQYSFTQSPEELEALKGKSSVFITDNRFERDPRNDQIFESCEERKPVLVYRDGELARQFNVYLCRGFRGL